MSCSIVLSIKRDQRIIARQSAANPTGTPWDHDLPHRSFTIYHTKHYHWVPVFEYQHFTVCSRNSPTLPQLLQFDLTQYTSFSYNYVWRKKGWLLDPKSPKKWRILSSKSFRFCGHQSMHVLQKVWFWSKSHCTEDLEKVQNHQYRFHTVEKRFWFRSRSAYGKY